MEKAERLWGVAALFVVPGAAPEFWPLTRMNPCLFPSDG